MFYSLISHSWADAGLLSVLEAGTPAVKTASVFSAGDVEDIFESIAVAGDG